MKKLRIALIAPQPYVEARGTPLAVLRMVTILSELGHEVHVITFPFGQDPEEHPLVKIHRCKPVPRVKSVKIGFSYAKLVLDFNVLKHAYGLLHNNKFDCIHGIEEGAFMGLLLSRLHKIPLVYDMDSVMSHEISQSKIGKLPFMVNLARFMESRTITNSAIIVTISDSMAEYARGIVHNKDIFVVPDVPITPGADGPHPERALEQIPPELRKDRKIILYAGSLAHYQGIDLLLEAMRKVASVRPEALLVIVGGDKSEIDKFQTANLVDNLVFLGKKPQEQIPDFLSIADILVSPRRGGINPPAKIYTYMQSGKPIVATDVPANSSVLGEDGAFLVKTTPDSIADGIIQATANPDLAHIKTQRAMEIVSEITPDLQKRRITEAYRTLEAMISTVTPSIK